MTKYCSSKVKAVQVNEHYLLKNKTKYERLLAQRL